jgi:hypothetical protein
MMLGEIPEGGSAMARANLATLVTDTAEDEPLSVSETICRAKLLVQASGAGLDFKLTVLNSGSCEPLKLGVHAAALGLAVLMGGYNAAAWLRRREQHLAANAILYTALIALEYHHVAHHLALLRKAPAELH